MLRLVALRAAYALVWCSVAPRVGLAQFCVFYACASSVLLGLVAAGSKWRRAFAEAAVLFAFLLALGAHRFDLALKAIATAVFLGAGACAAALDSSKQQL